MFTRVIGISYSFSKPIEISGGFFLLADPCRLLDGGLSTFKKEY